MNIHNNKNYNNFLKETLYSKEYDIKAHFIEKDKKIFIVREDTKEEIFFNMRFSSKYYDVLLIAAVQLLESVIIINS